MYQKTPDCFKGIKYFTFLLLIFFSFQSSFAQNPIVTENALPGTPAAVWDIPAKDAGDLSIQGFATDISVNKGGTINFKIDVNTGADKNFNITIYRIGYYQGNGARQIIDLGNFTGVAQNACGYNATTGLTDCGNWTQTASWAVPATAVSGLYIAKLTRSVAGGGGTSHLAFIVRDDASNSDLFFKTSDATWQAYNPYGGNSLYVGATLPFNHASKVSYNRPYLTRSGGGGGGAQEDWFMNAEYPMIRFLEANGFDISYTTDLDIAKNNSNNINQLLNHKIFLSVGHDEYWSKEERNSVEAAKAAGKNLAFFSGNEVYWKTRWENSTDGTNTPFRTMVCYKEGTIPTPQENACGGKCDLSTNEWTGLWRDGCGYAGVTDACKPENALTGQISWDGTTDDMEVPAAYKNLRFWRGTPVASLGVGGVATMTPGTLGYEWDWEQYPESYPPGRVTMSSTSSDGHIHKLSLYKDVTSKALVFGAGTVQWAWGLDQNHDINVQGGGGPANISMQQATINLFADMGAQPDATANLETGLVRAVGSTDVTPPVTVITTPLNGASLTQGVAYTISGTATDVGGIVAGVDISVDGGITWQPATGTANWTLSWTPSAIGPVTIKSRAYDDIGNLESPGGSEGSANTVTVNVETPQSSCPCTIFTPAQVPTSPDNDVNDGTAVSLGVKFRAAFDGSISAIRFFGGLNDISPNHVVQLWRINSDGTTTNLGSATQASLPIKNAWNEVSFATPINITANTVYIAVYFSPGGHYANTINYFQFPVARGPLTAVADGDNGANGVYLYQTTPIAPPSIGFSASNYWVDVRYANSPDLTPPQVVSTSPEDAATGVNINTFVNATFDEGINPATVNSTNVIFKDNLGIVVPATITYISSSRTISVSPSSVLDYSSTYTLTLKSGATGIKDLAGNALFADFNMNFTTTSPPAIPSDDGAGGPVLIISNSVNPFSRYMAEILRAQGYTAFRAVDLTEVTPALLNDYDVILLGNMTVTAAFATTLTNWTNAGGTLIAQRPSALLLPLMGVSASGSVQPEGGYLLVNSTAGQPGAGIVNQTIQYHGVADQYSMQAGTTSLATLYSSATAPTTFPAITSHPVGINGGKAIAFAYDLSKSVVTTRQGNPALAGQSLDGQSGPIRSDNLFFNNWLDFNKVQIPQADEQQHLLTNILLQSNLHKKPLPHLWFLPSGFKAAVVMTGDDHNLTYGSTETRFNEYMTQGPNTPADVADWKAIRGTSYLFNGTVIPDDSVTYYQNQGFEIALHPNTLCQNFTPASLSSNISSQLSQLEAQLVTMTPPVTNRTHCMPWSDWSSQPTVENSLGLRFDVNYYYWPASWIHNRPGMFTGSGLPMRFADNGGNIIDTYQAPTQITDESGQDIPLNITTLLNNALDPAKQYFGVFTMNMHTDFGIHPGSDAIVAAATARNVPVVSAKQMLEWLDSRNNTVFSNMAWDNTTHKLSFDLTTSARNLQALVPFKSADGTLIDVSKDGVTVPFPAQTIKGIQYAFVAAASGHYIATYNSVPLPITLTQFQVTKQGDDARLNWTTTMEENNTGFEIQRSSDGSSWTVIGFVAGAGNSETEKNYQYLDKDLQAGTYYYRLRQVDYDGHSSLSKVEQVTFSGDFALDLKQNRPNPFNNSTTIIMVIPKSGQVQLEIYDQMGRPVQKLMDEFKTPGTYTITVNRNGLSSGIYYYKMNALGQSIVRKMTIL